MIFNKSIANEKYGTSFPFYPVQTDDPLALCLLSHVISCTIFMPPYMKVPVYVDSLQADVHEESLSIQFKDFGSHVLGTVVLDSANTGTDDDVQLPLLSDKGILRGYVELGSPRKMVQELLTGLSGAVTYMFGSKDLRVLPYCTHAVDTPSPGAVHLNGKVQDIMYLGRGLLFTGLAPMGFAGKTNTLSISVYAESPIPDSSIVPVRGINGVSQEETVWITPKNSVQDITVKTYDYILVQAYTEQTR